VTGTAPCCRPQYVGNSPAVWVVRNNRKTEGVGGEVRGWCRSQIFYVDKLVKMYFKTLFLIFYEKFENICFSAGIGLHKILHIRILAGILCQSRQRSTLTLPSTSGVKGRESPPKFFNPNKNSRGRILYGYVNFEQV
jgi:hypothetical protein